MKRNQGSWITPSKRIRSIAQLEREWDIFKSEIATRQVFSDNSQESKTERTSRGRTDLLYFGKTYFPEYFSDDWAPFHKTWPRISNIHGEPVLITALRGAGKSTFFAFLLVIHSIIYGLSHYIVLGAYDDDRACLMSARVLLELMYNPRLAADFGSFFPDEKKPAVGFFVANCPAYGAGSVAVQAISIGQNPRGMVWGAYRPDMALLDDVQSDKRARSKKWVSETLDWIFRGLVPAMAANYRMFVLATYLNTKCVASMLKSGGKIGGREYKAIKTFEFPAQEGGRPDGKPTWPAAYPMKRLRDLRGTLGSLIYNQEYLLIAISEDGTIFPDEWIKYYVPGELSGKAIDAMLTRIDPASKDAKKNCKKAVITGCIAEGIIYVRAAWIRNSSIGKMIDATYAQYEAHNPFRVTYEDNGGHALLGPLFDLEAEKRGYGLPTKPWTEGENKIQRIEQVLSSDIEHGYVRFLLNDSDQAILVEQLINFPNDDLDGPDCLAGLVRDLKEAVRVGRFSAKGGHRREAYEMTRGYS